MPEGVCSKWQVGSSDGVKLIAPRALWSRIPANGVDGTAHDIGDLVQAESLEHAEAYDLRLGLWQVPEELFGPSKFVGRFDYVRRIVALGHKLFDADLLSEHRPRIPLAQEIRAGVGYRTIQVGADRGDLLALGPVRERAHENLLHHVFGVLEVAQPAKGIANQAIQEHIDKGLELAARLGPGPIPRVRGIHRLGQRIHQAARSGWRKARSRLRHGQHLYQP